MSDETGDELAAQGIDSPADGVEREVHLDGEDTHLLSEDEFPSPQEAQPDPNGDEAHGRAEHERINAGQAPPLPLLQTEAAFLVYLDSNGHWVADDAAVNRPIQVARNSTFVDFHNAATTIAKDIVVQETASKTVALQQQIAMQMAEQMQTRQVAQAMGGPVGQGLGGGGLHVPRR